MATDAKRRDDFREKMAAHTERYGGCAIEAGLVGSLADNECRHGNLPADRERKCSCFDAMPTNGKASR